MLVSEPNKKSKELLNKFHKFLEYIKIFNLLRWISKRWSTPFFIGVVFSFLIFNFIEFEDDFEWTLKKFTSKETDKSGNQKSKSEKVGESGNQKPKSEKVE